MAMLIGLTAGTAAAGTTNALDCRPDEATLQLKPGAWLLHTDSKPHLKPHSNPYLASVFSICASSAAVGQQSTLNPLRF